MRPVPWVNSNVHVQPLFGGIGHVVALTVKDRSPLIDARGPQPMEPMSRFSAFTVSSRPIFALIFAVRLPSASARCARPAA